MIDALPDVPMPGVPSVTMYNDSPVTDDFRTAQFTLDGNRYHVSWSMLTDRESLLRQDTAAATYRLTRSESGACLWAGMRYSGRIGGQGIQDAWHIIQGTDWYLLDYVGKNKAEPLVGVSWDIDCLQVRACGSPSSLAATVALSHMWRSYFGTHAGWEQSLADERTDEVTRKTLRSENGPYLGAEVCGDHWSINTRINLHRVYWRIAYEW